MTGRTIKIFTLLFLVGIFCPKNPALAKQQQKQTQQKPKQLPNPQPKTQQHKQLPKQHHQQKPKQQHKPQQDKHQQNKYQILITCNPDKTRYRLHESLTFQIRVKKNHKFEQVKNFDFEATFPNENSSVTLLKENPTTLNYQTTIEQQMPQQTLTITLYKKGHHQELNQLEEQKEFFLQKIQLFEFLKQIFPQFARLYNRLIQLCLKIIETIDDKIEKLNIPLAEAHKTINVYVHVLPFKILIKHEIGVSVNYFPET